MTPQEAAEQALDAIEAVIEARELAEQAEAALLEAIKALGGNAYSAEARAEWIKMRKRIQAALKAADADVGDSDVSS